MDTTTMRSWLEAIGLVSSARVGATGEEVTFGAPDASEQGGVIQWRTPTLMDVHFTRRVPTAELATTWRDARNVSPPIAQLRDAVRYVAARFPLVTGDASEDDGGAVAYFSTVLFDEPMSRQAFALTVSSVVKAADMFNAGSKARAEQLAALASVQAR